MLQHEKQGLATLLDHLGINSQHTGPLLAWCFAMWPYQLLTLIMKISCVLWDAVHMEKSSCFIVNEATYAIFTDKGDKFHPYYDFVDLRDEFGPWFVKWVVALKQDLMKM